MSTTTARNTAYQYSGVDKKRGTVFEIQAGRVDVGASIQVRFDQQWSNSGQTSGQTQPRRCVVRRTAADFRPYARDSTRAPPSRWPRVLDQMYSPTSQVVFKENTP